MATLAAVSILVVTGTGTGVGKTVVTAAVAALAAARGARVAVVKPAQTGVGPRRARRPGRRTPAGGRHRPARARPLPRPALPGRGGPPGRGSRRWTCRPARVRLRDLAADRDLVLVEGAGGLLVRYDEEGATIADLAHALAAAVLVVVDPGLGTLNHTALTLEAMAHRGLALAGVVIGAWPAEPDLACRSNVRDLETLAARPLAGALRPGPAPSTPPEFLLAARAGLAPALGGTFDAADFRRADHR